MIPACTFLLVVLNVNWISAVPPPGENPCTWGFPNCQGCSGITLVNEYYGRFPCRQVTLLTFADGIRVATVNRELQRITCDAADAKGSVFLNGRKLIKLECLAFATETHEPHSCFTYYASTHYINRHSIIPIKEGVAEFACRERAIITYMDNTSKEEHELSIRISCDQNGNIYYQNKEVKSLRCDYFLHA